MSELEATCIVAEIETETKDGLNIILPYAQHKFTENVVGISEMTGWE